MEARAPGRLLQQLTRALPKLRVAQLEEVLAFVVFLAGQEDRSLEKPSATPSPKETPEPSSPDDGDFASLAWMLRLVFGDAALPEEVTPLPADTARRVLDGVPLIAQQQNEWCWAATTQMILSYLGDLRLVGDPAAVQLEVVRSVDRERRGRLPARHLDVGGWPPFWQWGFEAEVVHHPQTLGPDAVQAELDAGRPLAVSWRYPGGSGHMLVIVGYLWVGDVLWLVAHDSWPPGKDGGDRSLISYDHYVRGLAGTWRTYYRIRRSAGSSAQRPQSSDLQSGVAADEADPMAVGWEAFLEVLGDSEQRNQAIAQAISLLRALAQERLSGGRDLGIFSSDPGDPEALHFFHALPVLQLPRKLDLADETGMMQVFSSFNRAVVMVGGEHGHLSSITIRQSHPGGPWRVIRIGRSHLVKAFDLLDDLLVEGLVLKVGSQELIASRHLTHLPLVLLRMPDARQLLLMMEVVGAPRRRVPFLFFPVYRDARLGFEPGQPLVLEDLQRALDWEPPKFPTR